MITHVRQPSKTSCGPTCVAMLTGRPVADVIADLKQTRRGRRTRVRTHSSNVGEIARLLAAHDLRLDRRERGWPQWFGTALLRLERARGRNWHWALYHDNVVYDPSQNEPLRTDVYEQATGTRFTHVLHYPIDRI